MVDLKRLAVLSAILFSALQPCLAAPVKREVLSTSTGLTIGPIAFDANLDDIRAALPEAAWRDTWVSPFSGRIFAIAADRALVIGDIAFNIEVQHRYYDRSLRLWSQHQVEDAAGCDRAALGWLAELEGGAGPFYGGEPRRIGGTGGGIYWSTTRQANGGVTVSASPRIGSPSKAIDEKVSFGERSSANVIAYDDDNRIVRRKNFPKGDADYYSLQAHNQLEQPRASASAAYFRSSGVCELSLLVTAWEAQPDPEYFAFDTARLVGKPTLAERHFIVSMIEGGLVETRDYVFDCQVSRVTARAEACTRKSMPAGAESVPDFAYKAARLLAEGVEFDLSAFDRDDSRILRTIVPVRLDPEDVKATNFAGRTKTPSTAIEMIAAPTAEDAAYAYSRVVDSARNEATITLVCEVQEDGSAVCASDKSDDPEEAAFAVAAREASLSYRIAPRLKGGGPSAGAVFETSIRLAPVKRDAAEIEAFACGQFGFAGCADESTPDLD